MRFIFKDHVRFAVVMFLTGILIILGVLASPGCDNPIPPIDISFWAGDSQKGGISRAQEHKTISCADPAFDDFTCLTYEDIQKIYAVLLQCKEWSEKSDGLVLIKASEVLRKFKKRNPEVYENAISKS